MIKRLSQIPHWVFLVIIGLLVFVPFLGNVHLFDWDEINFAESAREMLLTHQYRTVQINFQPFYEKPPFYIWLQALSMSYFGVSEFAARFPNAVIGIATLLTVYNAGRRYFDRAFGIWWAMLFACSILPQLYFKSGIIDPVFNYFIFLSLYFLFIISIRDEFESSRQSRKTHRWYLIASALAAGLAVLTKGPVALALIMLVVTVILLINKGKLNFNLGDLLVWLVVITIVIASWLSIEVRANGLAFIDNFIAYQIRLFTTEDAGHGGPIYYHLLILLIGCFPASILALAALRRNPDDTYHQVSFKRWMMVLLAIVLILFSIVKTKIIHYSSLCYFPVTFLGAYYIHHLLERHWRWIWIQTTLTGIIGGTLALTVGAAVWIGSHHMAIPFIPHTDMVDAVLGATVYWSSGDIAIPVLFAAGLIGALVLISRGWMISGVATLLIATCLFTNLTVALIVPRAEKYSQAALIEFIQSKKLEDCYIEVIGFKSYAQLFYKDKKAPASPQELDMNYLFWGPITKPLYVITKLDKLPRFMFVERYTELYRKNGYVFMKRK